MPEIPSSEKQANITAGIAACVMQILIMFLIMGLELFLGAGTIHWEWAWAFLGIGLVSVSINAFFMLRTSRRQWQNVASPRK